MAIQSTKHCANCGKTAHRGTEKIWNPFTGSTDRASVAARAACPDGTTRETWDYRGNAIVVRRSITHPGQWGSNNTPFVHWVTVWDGQTWTLDYDPFCTLRCAWIFAKACHEAGYRITNNNQQAANT